MNLRDDSSVAHDPVAMAIERLLCEMHSEGVGEFRQALRADSVVAHFGDMRGEGITLDIALVRLASAMMDDVKYTRFLIEALREPKHAASA